MMRADAMSDASPRTASPPVRWRGPTLVLSCSPCVPGALYGLLMASPLTVFATTRMPQ